MEDVRLWLLASLAVLSLILSAYSIYKGQKRLAKTDASDINTRLTKIETMHKERTGWYESNCKKLDQIGELKIEMAKMSVVLEGVQEFIRALDPALVGKFHAPIHFERDALLEAMEAGTLDLDGARRLEEMAWEITQESKKGNEELWARLLLGRARMLVRRLEVEEGAANGSTRT